MDKPQFAELHSLMERGDVALAEAQLKQARATCKGNPEFETAWADLQRRSGNMRAALAACLELTRSNPAWHHHRYIMIDAAAQLGDLPDALNAVEAMAASSPADLATQFRAEAWHFMGLDGKFAGAAARTGSPETQSYFIYSIMRSLSLMRSSGISAGIGDYAQSWSTPKVWQVLCGETAESTELLWHGQCQPPKRLRLKARGGIGDHFLFSRYLYLLQSLGVEIPDAGICGTDLRGSPLATQRMRANGWQDLPPAPAQEMWTDPFGLFTSAFPWWGHAPIRLGLQLPESALAESIARQARVRAGGRPCLALFWNCNESPGIFALKSMCLPDAMPLLEWDAVHWVVIQRGPQMAQWLSNPLSTTTTNVETRLSVDDMAGLLARLDATVTVDSAVAHVAASLGTPTYLLASRAASWIYEGFERHTPWYDSMTLCRQRQLGDWASAIQALRRVLPV